MYSLFSIARPIEQGLIVNPRWAAVKAGLERNVQTLLRYYQNNVMTVASSHFLMSILNRYGSMQPNQLLDVYQYVDSNCFELAKVLNMTSPLSQGKSFNGTFFGPGIREVLVASNESFDYQDVYRHWKDVSAVNVLYHPFDNLDMPIANGINYTDQKGFAVIEINIPKLIIQYKAFRHAEYVRLGSMDNQRSAMQFIAMFVLPNMLPSQLDWAIFNRYYNLALNYSNTKSRVKHPVHIPDWTKLLDEVALSITISLQDKSLLFSSLMRNIRLIGSQDLLERSKLPTILISRQNRWAMLVARIKVVQWLLVMDRAGHGRVNGTYINHIVRTLIQLKRDSAMTQALPRFVGSEIIELIESIEVLSK